MNLIFPNSIDGYVNHFADYILNSVPNGNMTVIKVTLHFPNVMIIQGYDFTRTIYNFSKLHSDFLQEFPHYIDIISDTKISFIDLINDKTHKGFLESFWFTCYNTPRPIYNSFQLNEFIDPTFEQGMNMVTEDSIKFSTPNTYKRIIETPIIESQFMATSSYPFGFSKHLRSVLYTSEFIAYNLFRIVKTNKMFIHNINMSPLNLDETLEIKCKCSYSEKKLVSLVLDTLTDYDLEEVIEDYDTSKDFFEPIADKPWLEAWKVGELVMF